MMAMKNIMKQSRTARRKESKKKKKFDREKKNKRLLVENHV